MAVRLIEVFMPTDRLELARSSVSGKPVIDMWSDHLSDDKSQLHILVSVEESEEITDTLAEALADTIEQVRIICLPVEASIPETKPPASGSGSRKNRTRRVHRVSRDELYADVMEMINTSVPNTALTILSAIVAAIGLARNNVAMIIGAMVIAPLLGPNVGMSLAATLGDLKLGLQAVRENALRIGIAMLFAVLVGLFFTIDPTIPEILSRTRVSMSDVAVALAAGAAGALALTTGAPTALIGVMVAAALMPPLVTMGILLGEGLFSAAYGSLILLLVNLICINLSGVLVFLLMGVRPWSKEDSSRARKSVWVTVTIWVVLLAVLIAAILTRTM